MANKPAVGAKAPDFTAKVTGGEYGEEGTVTLSGLAGENVVLFFYPKDQTPGCTAQACSLRDNWNALSGLAHVFGISPDGLTSHRRFAERKKLPFPLISDPKGEIIGAYGCWRPNSLLGLFGMPTERTTFVIGADQRILAVLERVNPFRHVSQLLEILEN